MLDVSTGIRLARMAATGKGAAQLVAEDRAALYVEIYRRKLAGATYQELADVTGYSITHLHRIYYDQHAKGTDPQGD